MTPLILACCTLSLTTAVPAQLGDAADAERALARGREALASGRFDEAGLALEKVARDRPSHPAAWALLARARCGAAEQLAARGEEHLPAAEDLLDRAEEAARRAIELDPGAAGGWAALGHLLVRAGRSDEAAATLYHAERLAAPTPELLLDLADALLAARQFAVDHHDAGGAAGKLAEAEAALDRAGRLFEPHSEALRRRAELHALKGEPKLALAHYRRAIHLQPGDTSLLEAHLALVGQTEAFDEAIDFYTGLVDTPALSRWYRSRAHELRGNVRLRRLHDHAGAAGDYLAAEHDFRASARLDPELKRAVNAYLPSLRSYRGHAFTLAERFNEAEAALFSAIDLDPAHEGALAFLHELQDAMWKKFGGESMPKERWEEMRAFASKLCTVEPGNAANWNNWGFFARESGKYEESYLAYRRALALDPRNARYLNDTALILMYHLDRDLERAAEWLEESIALAEAGMHDAERATARRVEDEVTLGDAYGNLVNLLQGTGRKEQAIARLREFGQKLPKRSEVDHWTRQLLPDEWNAEQERKQAEAEAEAARKAAEQAAGQAAEGDGEGDEEPPEGDDDASPDVGGPG